MEGLGNTFFIAEGPLKIMPSKVEELCNQPFGEGADGVLVVTPQSPKRVKMEYWNADGSVAEMCGNGLRCVAYYAVDTKMVEPGKFTVDTPVGSLKVEWDGNTYNDVETQVGKVKIEEDPIELYGSQFYTANVGNPHAITFVKDPKTSPVTELGIKVENDPHFPNKTNVEFMRVLPENRIEMRVWERGVGETKACGTGIVAVAALARKLDLCDFPVTVMCLGGEAKVWEDDEGYMRMKAPCSITDV